MNAAEGRADRESERANQRNDKRGRRDTTNGNGSLSSLVQAHACTECYEIPKNGIHVRRSRMFSKCSINENWELATWHCTGQLKALCGQNITLFLGRYCVDPSSSLLLAACVFSRNSSQGIKLGPVLLSRWKRRVRDREGLEGNATSASCTDSSSSALFLNPSPRRIWIISKGEQMMSSSLYFENKQGQQMAYHFASHLQFYTSSMSSLINCILLSTLISRVIRTASFFGL